MSWITSSFHWNTWMKFQLYSVALHSLHLFADDMQCKQSSRLPYSANTFAIFQRQSTCITNYIFPHMLYFSCSEGLYLHLTRFLATECWMQILSSVRGHRLTVLCACLTFSIAFSLVLKEFPKNILGEKLYCLSWPCLFSVNKTMSIINK